ncbi:MAC/perforin domain-containing protein [Bacteroides sp. CR5/BHMF/2]|nr:MAC/perforin domain-containing protein [Bacteroides sp. CR5/BHMF/2]
MLGYGYDVTGEYLHPLSVRNPVLNITKYDQEKHERVQYGTSSFGHDQMYYGYSASDYTKDIINETNVDSNMSYGNEKVDTVPYFSGNITNNNYLKTEYAYSDKYSFASVDAVRNRKYIKINDEVSSLSQYLSDSFKEDLERLSPDRLVERYGTHVLTDFIIGGRYKLMYRSVITHTKDATHKKTTVASGLKAALFGIGFSLNISRTVQTDESLVKDNQNKELFVQFYGGNGTSLKYDLEKGMPTGIDVQSWENSVSLSNACLTNINWKETYPIYNFISDPVKRRR